MIILAKIKDSDVIGVLVIALLCAVLYLASGIILMVKRDQNLISKKYTFRNPDNFTKLYSLLEIIFGGLTLVVSTVGLFFLKEYKIFISISFVLIVTLLIVQIYLQKKFRDGLKGGKAPVKKIRPANKPVKMKDEEEK